MPVTKNATPFANAAIAGVIAFGKAKRSRTCGSLYPNARAVLTNGDPNTFSIWSLSSLMNEALTHLSGRDPRLSQIVEMRFFAGLTEEEIGGALGISTRTVKRDWLVAKAWLRGELSSVKSDDNGPVGTSQGSNG